ncbi:hypothetical protein MKW98_013360 [Papaver atlanticum]|uniref:Peptidase A1 domain-containing protein n=1 Tax=Papaver atlanticum TaxID=357466 RepID=A0AAD4XKI6_9MAGN|nr:hypothetical protein MKW98_013360 [Papaver atlanticum]
MATSSSLSSFPSYALLPLVLLVLVSSSCFICATALSLSDHKPNTNPAGFTMRLIHRDSPESPFYDPKLTDAEKNEKRNRLTRRRPNDVRIPADYRLFEYVVSFSVGTPPVDTYAAMDTATDITWIQCRPCDNCFTQERGVPIFDPRKSSSYVKYGCMDPMCRGDYGLTCDRNGTFCSYHRRYYSDEQSQGIFSSDKFGFLIQDNYRRRRAKISVRLPFGCGHNNSVPGLPADAEEIPGVFGLNKEPLSSINQLGYKRFSHCFIPKGRRQTSLLRLGEDAIITNETTPMVEFGNETLPDYYVSLKGISVGETRLNIPQDTFKTSRYGLRGVYIDTGSTGTELARGAFDIFLEELVKQIKLKREYVSNFDLCYEIRGDRDMEDNMPEITFHFTGLDYVVQRWNGWARVAIDNDFVCLMFRRAIGDLTIIGNHQLQDVNVGYDLENKLISLQNRNCRLVD